MHSNRMRTIRCSGPGGVSQHALGEGVCILACTGQGGVYLGGCLPKSGVWPGGVCQGVSAEAVCLPGGVCNTSPAPLWTE